MEITPVIELISSVGFPITSALTLGYFIYQLWKQSVDREDKLMAINSEAISTLSMYAEKLTTIEDTVEEIKRDIENLTTS